MDTSSKTTFVLVVDGTSERVQVTAHTPNAKVGGPAPTQTFTTNTGDNVTIGDVGWMIHRGNRIVLAKRVD